MILSATLSKPAKNISEIFGKSYVKIRFTLTKDSSSYLAEAFTVTQAFQKKFTLKEGEAFIKKHSGTSFKNAVCKIKNEDGSLAEERILANKKGEIKVLKSKIKSEVLCPQLSLSKPPLKKSSELSELNRKKNYILSEGKPIPFLVKLGVMTKEGKVVSSRYDKFRQINRFLEFVKDITEDLEKIATNGKGFSEERPLRIADFGCGKSYLTFAVHYYLHEICHIPLEITGLDLKEDVIKKCNETASELKLEGIHFFTGDVSKADEHSSGKPDLMMTLHACDTATDYALKYAINSSAAAILSVPCCQHEINTQLEKKDKDIKDSFSSLERWGILRERFSALATDALRGELLEQAGYSVQMLEFIDMEGTPKNILIRAIKKQGQNEKAEKSSRERSRLLIEQLGVSQKLNELLKKSED